MKTDLRPTATHLSKPGAVLADRGPATPFVGLQRAEVLFCGQPTGDDVVPFYVHLFPTARRAAAGV